MADLAGVLWVEIGALLGYIYPREPVLPLTMIIAAVLFALTTWATLERMHEEEEIYGENPEDSV